MIGNNMKNTFKICFLFLILFSSIIKAELVTTEVSPPEPLVNESFYLTFKVKMTGDADPYITFTPSNVQVLGKREQGVSIQTTVINGKISTTKEQNIVYELQADRTGTAYIRNIKVEINGKVTPVRDVTINILATPKRIPDAFMEAEVSKTKVYVGEGIDVNYYLYFKSSIAANDVKDFPKLNKFIKRFHHINSPVETVQYKHEVLKRILAYSARIYPEKPGMAVIDPMRISVQVIEADYGGLGGFGFGSQRYKNKDLASNRVEIEVLPLPTEGIPAGFTGLVGEHEFTLIPGKGKYLVNEPIEFKLEVKGKGALEKFDAPGIYSDPNLEVFDTKAELTEIGNTAAKKVFEYTLLARNSLSIPPRELSLSYFDPNTGKYVEKKISIPGLEVSGAAAPSSSNQKNETANLKKDDVAVVNLDNFFANIFNLNSKIKGKPVELGLVGPWFKEESFLGKNSYYLINLILACSVILMMIWWQRRIRLAGELELSSNIEAKKIFKDIKKNGINYSNLFKLLSFLDKTNRLASGGISIIDIIESSSLSNESKQYFVKSLSICERANFGVSKERTNINYESKYFSELMKLL